MQLTKLGNNYFTIIQKIEYLNVIGYITEHEEVIGCIISLNDHLINYDIDQLSIEIIEHRKLDKTNMFVSFLENLKASLELTIRRNKIKNILFEKPNYLDMLSICC